MSRNKNTERQSELTLQQLVESSIIRKLMERDGHEPQHVMSIVRNAADERNCQNWSR